MFVEQLMDSSSHRVLNNKDLERLYGGQWKWYQEHNIQNMVIKAQPQAANPNPFHSKKVNIEAPLKPNDVISWKQHFQGNTFETGQIKKINYNPATKQIEYIIHKLSFFDSYLHLTEEAKTAVQIMYKNKPELFAMWDEQIFAKFSHENEETTTLTDMYQIAKYVKFQELDITNEGRLFILYIPKTESEWKFISIPQNTSPPTRPDEGKAITEPNPNTTSTSYTDLVNSTNQEAMRAEENDQDTTREYVEYAKKFIDASEEWLTTVCIDVKSQASLTDKHYTDGSVKTNKETQTTTMGIGGCVHEAGTINHSG